MGNLKILNTYDLDRVIRDYNGLYPYTLKQYKDNYDKKITWLSQMEKAHNASSTEIWMPKFGIRSEKTIQLEDPRERKNIVHKYNANTSIAILQYQAPELVMSEIKVVNRELREDLIGLANHINDKFGFEMTYITSNILKPQ